MSRRSTPFRKRLTQLEVIRIAQRIKPHPRRSVTPREARELLNTLLAFFKEHPDPTPAAAGQQPIDFKTRAAGTD